ncbi:hypothetical protein MANES_11G072967v8 [Manihot esculenta]|uniref:Uncharacterized protein n=1 Tax=Manihot esculenta TaxID=3983 RepID=A0ACB7GTY7_MANES|nr:hypothetical protein MANES_11G072967v8 [Manihot esculenta]
MKRLDRALSAAPSAAEPSLQRRNSGTFGGTFGGRKSFSRDESQALSAAELHLRRPKVCFQAKTQLSGARLGGQTMHPQAG